MYYATMDRIKGGMASWVDNLRANGNTNFVDAFEMAHAIMETHSKSNACHRSIMFLTDGQDSGDYTKRKHEAFVQRAGRTRVFTYSFGDNADETWPKRIACDTGGIWYKIPDNGNIANTMAKYYEFYASLMTGEEKRWVEYADAWTGVRLLASCRMTYTMDEVKRQVNFKERF